MSQKDAVRKVIKEWAENTKLDKKDAILQNHADKVVIFDVLPPMRYASARDYRASWDQWHPNVTSESLFEIHELVVEADETLAFAHCFIECGGKLADGHAFKDWVRSTFCLRFAEGKWTIMHQHVSKPMKAS